MIFLAVYPLTLTYSLLVNAVFDAFDIRHVYLKGLLVTLLISFTMVYKVMPYLLRRFDKWLKQHPGPVSTKEAPNHNRCKKKDHEKI